MTTTPESGRYLSTAEVAELVGASIETIKRWCHDGRLPGAKPGGRRMGWRIHEADFKRFMDAAKPGQREEEA